LSAVIAAMPVEIWDVREFTPAQAKQIGDLIAQVWPKPHLTAADRVEQQLALSRQYQGKPGLAPRSFVVVEDDRVMAHAAMLPREIRTTQGDMIIGGLARVCTDSKVRGRGLGELVVRAAFGTVDAGDFPFALFQTNHKTSGFYEKFGAVPVHNTIINSLGDGPKTCPFWDEVVLRYPGGGDWPSGTIDLRGPGF
jgi:predicted N-acetyltransferase YhbS